MPGQQAVDLAERALAKAQALDAKCTLLVLSRGTADAQAHAEVLAAARKSGAEAHCMPLAQATPTTMLDALRPWLSAAQRPVLMLQRQPDGLFGAGTPSARLAARCADSLPHVRVQLVPAAPRHRHLRWPNALRADWLDAWWPTLQILLACTLAGELMKGYFEPANTLMIYMAGTTLVGFRAGMRQAVAFVLGSVVLYDLIFLPPYWTLIKLGPQYYFTFGVMLAVGCLISRLASNVRMQTLELEARARRAQARNDLSYDLVRASTVEHVQAALRSAVDGSLEGAAELLLPGPDGRLQAVDAPQPQFADRDTAARVLATGQHITVGSCPVLLHLALPGSGPPLGVLVVKLDAPLCEEARDAELLRAFADKVAVVLQRLRLEALSARSALEAESERVRNTLLAAISHDFRSPMTTIVGSVSSLLEQHDALPPTLRERLLRGVLSEARRVHSLMSNLLDLTRIEGGAVRLNPEWCPVDELFAASLAAQGATLGEHRVSTTCDPDALLWCDPRLMEQLLNNVLENAARHAPAGSQIRVRFEAGEAAARVVVQDDGPGFPPGREQDMMKKFMRGSRQAGHGTGLGLAICAAIARLHAGELELSNQGGAQVALWLPQPACAPVTDDSTL
ncbi:ATP-binding protein [Roseateles sp.]|uniref:ATP-binding protein n=1 Tax=Roseateles sp. TaxID=1971397 RepID=UPI003BAAFA3B